MSTPDLLRAMAEHETGCRKLAVAYLISAGWTYERAFVPPGGGHGFELLDDATDYQMGIDDAVRAA